MTNPEASQKIATISERFLSSFHRARNDII